MCEVKVRFFNTHALSDGYCCHSHILNSPGLIEVGTLVSLPLIGEDAPGGGGTAREVSVSSGASASASGGPLSTFQPSMASGNSGGRTGAEKWKEGESVTGGGRKSADHC